MTKQIRTLICGAWHRLSRRSVTWNRKSVAIVALLIAIIFSAAFTAPDRNMFSRRSYLVWGWPTRQADDAHFLEILDRAAKAGYNQVFHNDPAIQLATVKDDPAKVPQTIDGLKRWKSECDKKGVLFLPFALGPASPTRRDVNLAEAMPVKGTPFEVMGDRAAVQTLLADVKNGGFEVPYTTNENIPQQWRLSIAAPGIHCFLDKTERRPGSSGSRSLMWKDPPRATLTQRGIPVKPGRAYSVSVWIKTLTLSQARWVQVLVYGLNGDKKQLLDNRYTYGVSQTQAWKRHDFDFNALDQSMVEIHVKMKEKSTGSIWFDDLEVREIGLFELVRRPSLPVVVKSETGEIYEEGKDYTIQSNPEVIADQQAVMSIPSGSRIKSGQNLLVDWYQYADMVSTLPPASHCSKEAWDVLGKIISDVSNGFGTPPAWMLKHGEWRLANYDPACLTDYGIHSAGEYYGSVLRKLTEMIRETTGNAAIETYALNDDFDPYHNCRDPYFLVNGPVVGAWNYLDPQTIIMNWNVKHRLGSILFFAGMDSIYKATRAQNNTHFGQPPLKINVPLRQILSVNEGVAEPWLAWLDSAEAMGLPADATPGINFNTWTNNWDGLEYMATVTKATGRWLEGPPTDIGEFSAVKDEGRNRAGASGIHAHVHHVRVAGSMLKFRLPLNAEVAITIHDLLGRKVWDLARTKMNSGTRKVDLRCSQWAKGVYLVNLEIRSTSGKVSRTTKRMIRM